jgi:hypothetical protein
VDSEIIAGIWNEFTDREVYRVAGGHPLGYYREYTCKEKPTRGLIKDGDGQCGAWCSFFVDMLKVHGIDNLKEGRQIRCKAAEGFMINNWGFKTPSGAAPYPYVNMKSGPDDAHIGPTGYLWVSSEVDDLGGVPGQGRNNPASLFINHFVIQIGSTYYDPSYGKVFTNPDAMDGEIAGFYTDTTYSFLARPNPSFDLTDSSTIDIRVMSTPVDF